jgi:hypothetical protein
MEECGGKLEALAGKWDYSAGIGVVYPARGMRGVGLSLPAHGFRSIGHVKGNPHGASGHLSA